MLGDWWYRQEGATEEALLLGIEHYWEYSRDYWEVNRIVVSRFLNIFLFLENRGAFIPTDEVHLYCLHIVYLPLINAALTEFVAQWSDHPVTTETNLSPHQMWTQGMLQLRHSNLTAVWDIVDGVPSNIEDFGIEEGPVPTSYPDLVSVPQSTVEVSY